MLFFNEWNKGTAADSSFSNNLFIVEEGGRATYDFGPSTGNVFENNVFCGHHEGLPAKATVTPAPRLAGRVRPAPGLDPLQALRPAEAKTFPRGVLIKDNGGRDFFGNPLPPGQPPRVGAFEK